MLNARYRRRGAGAGPRPHHHDESGEGEHEAEPLPATEPVDVYPVRVEGEDVLVDTEANAATSAVQPSRAAGN